MKQFLIATLLIVPFTAAGASMTCGIKPSKNVPTSALPGLAKISMADAQAKALARLKVASAEVASAELEIEQGCLVYSFDIKLAGKSGVEEVMIDAGTGKVVSQKHESSLQEAAEKAKDNAEVKKAK